MNKHFKIPVYVLALLLVCAAQTAGAVTVYVNNTSGDYGAMVDIPINVSSTSNIGAMDISLTYNPAVITATGVVANGTLISATDLIANHTATSGIVNISVASLYGINGTGSIAVIQFHVEGSNSETSILDLNRAEAYDLDNPIYDEDGNCTGYVELDVTTCNATFIVSDGGLPQTGDINGNDAVTLADAIYLAKHVAGMSGYETLSADGDINGNDAVTLADAIYLAKHVAGMSGYETLY